MHSKQHCLARAGLFVSTRDVPSALGRCVVLAIAAVIVLWTLHRPALSDEPTGVAEQAEAYWWQQYPTWGSVSDGQAIRNAKLRLVLQNIAADPVWGLYSQYSWSLVSQSPAAQQQHQELKESGVRYITWVEAFGDCVMYAGALEQQLDGTFVTRPEQPEMARLARTAWTWETHDPAPGNVYRWVGLHNTANDEDFVQPLFARERTGFPTPAYPDGRPAIGSLPDKPYPANALIYDACCAKDINGDVDLSGEGFMAPKRANAFDPATSQRLASTEGLYPLVLGPNQLSAFPGRQLGDVVYISHMAASKDPACPFWSEYIRVSLRRILADGLDGLWCDNYACYNNLGMPPLRNGFGDWSEQRFREFLESHFTQAERTRIGVPNASDFDVRAYLKKKAIEFGAQDPSAYADAAWVDRRWLDDPVWNAYKVCKQHAGQEALRTFYTAIKEEAARAGRPDFCVAGNDLPVYGLGWGRDEYLDMVSSEQTPGWWVTTGSRGIMIPPLGKYAVVYRAALEHQQGPYATMWYSLAGPYAKHGESTTLGKVLSAEAFANSTFLKYVPNSPYAGTEESHAWWNDFVIRHEDAFGRRWAVADVGILYSPDNQLADVLPGAHAPDHDRQPHSFGHWGFATAAIDAHLPYRVVTDWKLTPESLRGLRTFVVPSAECLDDPVLPVLTQWVEGGGRLVVTGPAGMRAGTQGMFRRRDRSLLEPLVGHDMSQTGAQVWTRQLGQGTVVWTPAPLGVEYYLQHEQRSERLGQLVELIGPSPLLDGADLPSTVGVCCWQSADSRTLFADLVNYDFDAVADRVAAVEDLRLRLRVPPDTVDVAVTTFSPDGEPPATAQLADGWATLHLPRLMHYASIKLTTR